MNNYYKNIKLTIEINSSNFLDTRMDIKGDGITIQKHTKRKPNSPFFGHQKHLKHYSVKGFLKADYLIIS